MANSRITVYDTEIMTDGNGAVAGIVVNGKTTWFPRIVAQSGQAVTLTGSTAETTLARVVIPAQSMTPHGRLRVRLQVTNNSGVNNKTFRVKLGATTLATWTQTTNTERWDVIEVANRGNLNNQLVLNTLTGNGATTPTTATLDTGAAQELVITGQLATGTDNLALEQYSVEVLPS